MESNEFTSGFSISLKIYGSDPHELFRGPYYLLVNFFFFSNVRLTFAAPTCYFRPFLEPYITHVARELSFEIGVRALWRHGRGPPIKRRERSTFSARSVSHFVPCPFRIAQTISSLHCISTQLHLREESQVRMYFFFVLKEKICGGNEEIYQVLFGIFKFSILNKQITSPNFSSFRITIKWYTFSHLMQNWICEKNRYF